MSEFFSGQRTYRECLGPGSEEGNAYLLGNPRTDEVIRKCIGEWRSGAASGAEKAIQCCGVRRQWCYQRKTLHCSPHSREVVKNLRSRSFGGVKLKGDRRRGPVRSPCGGGGCILAKFCATNVLSATASDRGEWRLSLRGGRGETRCVGIVRGPTRRRPYNRGAIITAKHKKKRCTLDFFPSVRPVIGHLCPVPVRLVCGWVKAADRRAAREPCERLRVQWPSAICPR